MFTELGCLFIHHKLSLIKQEKAGLQHELLITASGHHRRQLKEQLHEVEERINKSVSDIKQCEVWIEHDEAWIARIRGRAEERQRKEGE